MLVVLRIRQGMSVGGEFTGSVTFVFEHAKRQNRAMAASWIGVGASLGFLIGSGVGTLMMEIFTKDELNSWAWQLPFLSGILIAFVGYLIRRNATEPPRPSDMPMERSPVVTAVRDHWRSMLQSMGLALAVNSTFYMMFVYANTYLTEHMHFSATRAMEINTISLFVLTVLIPVSGWICDRIGRKPIPISGMLTWMVLSWPLSWMRHHATDTMILLGQMGFALIVAWIWGAYPAARERSCRRISVSARSRSPTACASRCSAVRRRWWLPTCSSARRMTLSRCGIWWGCRLFR